MSTTISINFRNTPGAVSDGANGAYVKDGILYPTTQHGITYGALYSADIYSNDNGQWSAGNHVSLYGFANVANDGGRYLQVDLAPGTYNVYYAFPKIQYTKPTMSIVDSDFATVLDTISLSYYTDPDAAEFFDSAGASHAFGASLPTTNFRTVTISGTKARFDIGDNSTGRTRLSYIVIEPTGGGGGGGSVFRPWFIL